MSKEFIIEPTEEAVAEHRNTVALVMDTILPELTSTNLLSPESAEILALGIHTGMLHCSANVEGAVKYVVSGQHGLPGYFHGENQGISYDMRDAAACAILNRIAYDVQAALAEYRATSWIDELTQYVLPSCLTVPELSFYEFFRLCQAAAIYKRIPEEMASLDLCQDAYELIQHRIPEFIAEEAIPDLLQSARRYQLADTLACRSLGEFIDSQEMDMLKADGYRSS